MGLVYLSSGWRPDELTPAPRKIDEVTIMLKAIVIRLLTWLFVRLGWPSAQYEQPDPNAPEFQPVIHDHPLFTVEVERLDVKRCIMGENQWFTVLAFGLDWIKLGGVRHQWILEDAGKGTVIDLPNWQGETRETDGACRFFHIQQPARYSLIVEGNLLVSNIRTDLPWKCYANGYCTHAYIDDFGNPGLGGWLAILKPGRFGYWIYLKLK